MTISEGENIARRITDLVAKLKILVEPGLVSELSEAGPHMVEEPDARGEKAPSVIAHELKG